MHHRKQVVTEEAAPKKRPPAKPAKSSASSRAKSQRRSVEEIEQEIRTLENELAELAGTLSNASIDWRPEQYAQIGERQEEIASKLEVLYAEWAERASTGKPNNDK